MDNVAKATDTAVSADTSSDSESSLPSSYAGMSFSSKELKNSSTESLRSSSSALSDSSDSSVLIFLTKADKERLEAAKSAAKVVSSDLPGAEGTTQFLAQTQNLTIDENNEQQGAKARNAMTNVAGEKMNAPAAKLMSWDKLLTVATDDHTSAAEAKTYDPASKDATQVSKYEVHPLLNSWVLWYLKSERKKPWEECLHKVGTFDTVEGLWNLYNAMEPPSCLTWSSDYYVFREGIKPLWEDESNTHGGCWVAKGVPPAKLDQYWLDLLLTMTGGGFDPLGKLVCGAAVSIRHKGDKVSLWTADSLNVDANMEIGKVMKSELEIPDSEWLRYEVHLDVANRLGSSVKPRLWLPVRYPTPAPSVD